VLVRLRQEVQEVPRRLTPPDPELADDVIRLTPLTQSVHAEMLELIEDDGVKRYTRVPAGADAAFVTGWIDRYERGWEDASRAGFAVQAHDGTFFGFAAAVSLDLDGKEAELGYAIAPAARGKGVATRSVALLTDWCFDALDLIRLELVIDVTNAGSEVVARRNGYTLEGVRRSAHVKDGQRADAGIWSRLRTDTMAP
jgi:RimJ/RimL family protein N-acetyltransferase